MELKTKSRADGGKAVKQKEDSGVSPELERELLELSAETKKELKAGKIKPMTAEEHIEWFRSL